MPESIVIDPITRLEGHGKIQVFLDEAGEVANAYLQVPELRGFEKFAQGRNAIDMPEITSRICGVCSPAHHLAATKALDAAFSVEPPPAAVKLRELLYHGYMVYDHILHFFYLGGPDFIVGPDAPPAQRNILGVIEKVGTNLALEVIKHRAYGQRIVELLGGKPISPVLGIPGGVNKGATPETLAEIKGMGESSVAFVLQTLDLFKQLVLGRQEYKEMVLSPAYRLECYDMGLVDEAGRLNLYDGLIRVTDTKGAEAARFHVADYLDHIAERVVPWSYVKLPYLKKVGWKDLAAGQDSGVYRVGPLARLNVAESLATPLAQGEFEEFFTTLGGRPVHQTLAFHWARLVELLFAAEMVVELASKPELFEGPLRNPVGEPGEGIGVIEAARGTLIHHYKVGPNRLIEKANLIVATTYNKIPIGLSIKEAAKGFIHGGKADQGVLNRVEMAFRPACVVRGRWFSLAGAAAALLIFLGRRRLFPLPKETG